MEPTIKVQLALAESEEYKQYKATREAVDWLKELPDTFSVESETNVESVQDYLFRENMGQYEEELKEFEEY